MRVLDTIVEHTDITAIEATYKGDGARWKNFFGLMKSELLYLQEWDRAEQFAKEPVKYIRYYNNDRIKLGLNGKSPVQYRALFQSERAS